MICNKGFQIKLEMESSMKLLETYSKIEHPPIDVGRRKHPSRAKNLYQQESINRRESCAPGIEMESGLERNDN